MLRILLLVVVSLAHASSSEKALQTMRTRQWSMRQMSDAVSAIEKEAPSLATDTIDELVRARFEFSRSLEDQKQRHDANRPGRGHANTVWDDATPSDIAALLARFDKAICSRSPRPGVKSWKYRFAAHPSPGGMFGVEWETLSCKP